jgi:N6-adenosine-specific RNA methylase IME4
MGDYRAILLDCPWHPKPWSVKGMGRHPSAYYGTMSLEEIGALPVRDYAAKDCSVFLWITDQYLVRGAQLPLFEAWGFTPSSVAFVWFKTGKRLGNQLPLFLIGDKQAFPPGQGLTTRINCEYCLLARYGALGRQDKGVPQAIFAPRRANSQKPDEQYERIERFVRGPYLEFFARQRRPGWDQSIASKPTSAPASAAGAPRAIRRPPRDLVSPERARAPGARRSSAHPAVDEETA